MAADSSEQDEQDTLSPDQHWPADVATQNNELLAKKRILSDEIDAASDGIPSTPATADVPERAGSTKPLMALHNVFVQSKILSVTDATMAVSMTISSHCGIYPARSQRVTLSEVKTHRITDESSEPQSNNGIRPMDAKGSQEAGSSSAEEGTSV